MGWDPTWEREGELYSEVQYIMGNGHMGNHPMNR